MSCNLANYLEEEKMTCLRIARSCDEGTQGRKEWLKTAQVLMDRAEDHKTVCRKCKQSSKQK